MGQCEGAHQNQKWQKSIIFDEFNFLAGIACLWFAGVSPYEGMIKIMIVNCCEAQLVPSAATNALLFCVVNESLLSPPHLEQWVAATRVVCVL